MSKGSRSSGVEERILAAARRLGTEKSLDRIGLSDVARAAGVSWPTVKRVVGSKEELRALLARERPELSRELPDTRRRLVDAAAEVFAERSYHGASLDEVASRAGLTKGAVYWHFASKRELLLGLVDDLVAGFDAEPPRDPSALPGWGALLVELVSASRDDEVRRRVAGLGRALLRAHAEGEESAASQRAEDDGRAMWAQVDPERWGRTGLDALASARRKPRK